MTKDKNALSSQKSLDQFAGIPVKNYAEALEWYECLMGCPPAFIPNDTEAVWELAEHRYIFVILSPEHAGHAMHTIFLDDLEPVIARITKAGIKPTKRETYSNGVRKVIYHDPDKNEISFGGEPLK